VKDKKTELRINVTEKPKKLVAKVNKKTVKLMEVTTAEDFLKGENVYWYEATPNLNKFATICTDVLSPLVTRHNKQKNQNDILPFAKIPFLIFIEKKEIDNMNPGHAH